MSDLKSAADAAADARRLRFFELLGEGFYTAARGFIALSLPITERHAEQLVAAVERIIGSHRRVLSI